MNLSDTPGNWFQSQLGPLAGTPVTIINPGARVDFAVNECCTDTKHTVTLLVKPVGSAVNVDQAKPFDGKVSVTFDVPGVYVLHCKVHPYMTAVVAVVDPTTVPPSIPPVTASSLPFIGYLGVSELDALTVLSVMTTVAPLDDGNSLLGKLAKWDILTASSVPTTPGVGEVWVSTQFENVPGQGKPGTITVVNVDSTTAGNPTGASTFSVEREINGLTAKGKWNNPHNMCTDEAHKVIYNTNWFGKWLNKIDRSTGNILHTIEVGHSPSHAMCDPSTTTSSEEQLTVPLSAANDVVYVRDMVNVPKGLEKLVKIPTGVGRNHPHAHWLTSDGSKQIFPNVFKGLGPAGSISILNTATGAILSEIFTAPDGSPLLHPLATGIGIVNGVNKAYVSILANGTVAVVNMDTGTIIGTIPVTFTPSGLPGFNIFHTLQGPIQCAVSPDGKFAVVAVLSLTTVSRPPTGFADHIAVINTCSDTVVAWLPGRKGAHGVNWGAKQGGGYYAYVTNQHANVLTVVDPDPPGGPSDGSDAVVAGEILLANGSGAEITDGTGGQGVRPLPDVYNGWIQETVALSGSLSSEVQAWINQLTDAQKAPSSATCP